MMSLIKSLKSLRDKKMKNKCIHCSSGNKFDKEHCITCNGTGFTHKHIHKASGAYWYPLCNPGCTMHNAMVTRRWEIVTCPSCLKLRKRK